MKLIIVYYEDGEQLIKELSKDDFISFDKKNDLDVQHVLIVNERFNNKAGKDELRVTCSHHLDWCIDNLVKRYGKELFIQ